MILAFEEEINCPGRACFYNSRQEKDELLSIFEDQTYKVFTDDDKNNAKYYANVNKITGFSLHNMNNFQIISELIKNKIQAIIITDKNNNKNIAIINKTYFISSDEYLEYNVIENDFIKSKYTGSTGNIVENFCYHIKRFAMIKDKSLIDASYEYLLNYEKMFGSVPIKILLPVTITQDNDDIKFSIIAKDINYENYNTMLRGISFNKTYKETQVKSIKEKHLILNFKNKEIIQGIEKFLA